jgi:uncharacterized protein (DUF2132 family)
MRSGCAGWVSCIGGGEVRVTGGTDRQNQPMQHGPPQPLQPRNPLHGVTLESMVRALEAHYGWAELAARMPVRCFAHDPSVPSSLKFLRKTPWAREKVEGLYLIMRHELQRSQPPPTIARTRDPKQ